MKRLNLNVIKEINEVYDYNLPANTLYEILDELSVYETVSQKEIIDEFEYYAN